MNMLDCSGVAMMSDLVQNPDFSSRGVGEYALFSHSTVESGEYIITAVHEGQS